MKLRSYETRMLLRRYGIPIPEDRILGETEETYKINVRQELYLAIATDRVLGCPVLITLYDEGIALATLRANRHPAFRVPINPIMGLHAYQAHQHASEINIPREVWHSFVDIALKLYRCYEASDAELLEIDPLVLTMEDTLIAMTGRARIDDAALFRQPELALQRDTEQETTTEQLARDMGLPCVSMNGQIGCIVNGAGIGITIADLLDQYGAQDGIQAAHIIDIENDDTPERIAQTIQLVLEDGHTQVLLVSLFCGINRGDDVARHLLQAYAAADTSVPFIVRLEGIYADEGRKLLEDAGIQTVSTVATLAGAARLAIASVKGL